MYKQPSRKMFELKTSAKHSALFSLFSHVVTGDDPEVTAAKPAPIIYSVARARFPQQSAPGPQCLVFEVGQEAIQIFSTNIFNLNTFFQDAPNGVEAGLGAEMQVVMVPHNKVPKQYLLPATQVT